jgi:hypothetical protein
LSSTLLPVCRPLQNPTSDNADNVIASLQGFVFVNNDPEMVDAQGQHAKARNTNLNEDLGKVCYKHRTFQRTKHTLNSDTEKSSRHCWEQHLKLWR